LDGVLVISNGVEWMVEAGYAERLLMSSVSVQLSKWGETLFPI